MDAVRMVFEASTVMAGCGRQHYRRLSRTGMVFAVSLTRDGGSPYFGVLDTFISRTLCEFLPCPVYPHVDGRHIEELCTAQVRDLHDESRHM